MRRLYWILLLGATLLQCKSENGEPVIGKTSFSRMVTQTDSAYLNKAALWCYYDNMYTPLIYDSCQHDSISILKHTLKLRMFIDTVHPRLKFRTKLFQFGFEHKRGMDHKCSIACEKSYYYFKNGNIDSVFGFNTDDPFYNIRLNFNIGNPVMDSAYKSYFETQYDTISPSFYRILRANGIKYSGVVMD